MVDAAGTTAYAYAAGGQLWTKHGPFSSNTVTNGYTDMRTALFLVVGLCAVATVCLIVGGTRPLAALNTKYANGLVKKNFKTLHTGKTIDDVYASLGEPAYADVNPD